MITLELRNVDVCDLEKRVEWFNHNDAEHMNITRPLTIEKTRQWFEGAMTKAASKHFSVVNKQNGELVGFTGFTELDSVKGTGNAYLLIGNQSYKGKGLSRQIFGLVLKWFFEVFNGQTATCNVNADNAAIMHVLQTTGWQRDFSADRKEVINGVLRDRATFTFAKKEAELP